MEGLKVCVVNGDAGRHTLECEEGKMVGQIYGIETAHRVAACINLCSKLPTNVLMSISSLDTSALKGEVANQRDLLAAALREAQHALGNAKPIMEHYPEAMLRHEQALQAARSALEALEPSPAAVSRCLNDDDVVDAEWPTEDDEPAPATAAVPVIDWAEAPEGFPLWLEGTTEEHRKHSGWYRDAGQVFEGASGGQWRKMREGQFFIVHREPKPLACQPVAWNGECLPPAGVTCEYQINDKWNAITILAHVNEYGKKLAVFQFADGETWSSGGCVERFRPIRTAEQIAAEARIAAAQEWLRGIERDYGVTVADECENILMAAERARAEGGAK